jgi:hypothetical protein
MRLRLPCLSVPRQFRACCVTASCQLNRSATGTLRYSFAGSCSAGSIYVPISGRPFRHDKLIRSVITIRLLFWRGGKLDFVS